MLNFYTCTLYIYVTFSSVQFSSVAQSCPTLWPHESQHTRPPCPSPTPGVHSDSRPSSQWYHPAISSSVVPFSSCPQSKLEEKKVLRMLFFCFFFLMCNLKVNLTFEKWNYSTWKRIIVHSRLSSLIETQLRTNGFWALYPCLWTLKYHKTGGSSILSLTDLFKVMGRGY